MIPISNLKKQVQTPNASKGQAIDLSQNYQRAMQPALNTIKQIEQAGDSVLKFKIAQDRSDQNLAAQEAFNKYVTDRELLNTELSQKQGKDALAFRDKYYQKAEQMHQQFINQISQIKDADIRENFRQRVNSYNYNSASKVESHLFQIDQNVKDETLKSSLEIASDFAASAMSPLVDAKVNIANFDDNIQNSIADIVSRGKEKGLDDNTIRLSVESFVNTSAIKAAEQIARDSRAGGFLQGYQPTLNFIYGLTGRISPEQQKELARTYEKKQLDYEFAKDPLKFANKNNNYNEALAHQIAPNLDIEERFKRIDYNKAAKKSNKKLTDEQLEIVNEFNEQAMGNLGVNLERLGLLYMDKDLYEAKSFAPDSTQKKDFDAEQNSRRADPKYYNLSNLLKLKMLVDMQNNAELYIDDTGSINQVLDEKQASAAKAKGFDLIQQPTSKRLNALSYKIGELIANEIESGKFDYIEKRGFFYGQKPSVEEAMVYSLAKSYHNSNKPNAFRKFLGLERDNPISGAAASRAFYASMQALSKKAKTLGVDLNSNIDALTDKSVRDELLLSAVNAYALNSADAVQKSIGESGIQSSALANMDNITKTPLQRAMSSFYDGNRVSLPVGTILSFNPNPLIGGANVFAPSNKALKDLRIDIDIDSKSLYKQAKGISKSTKSVLDKIYPKENLKKSGELFYTDYYINDDEGYQFVPYEDMTDDYGNKIFDVVGGVNND